VTPEKASLKSYPWSGYQDPDLTGCSGMSQPVDPDVGVFPDLSMMYLLFFDWDGDLD
jgi:hypothetical protein